MMLMIRSFIVSLLLAPLLLIAGSEDEIRPDFEFAQDEEASFNYLFDSYPPVYFPVSVHWLSSVSATGDSLELEDGSMWKISRYDGRKVLSWRLNDPLIITQNHRWFSNYKYRIINQHTGGILEANLFLGPVVYGEHTLYVCALDSFEDLLLIDSRGEITRWTIASNDRWIFQNWALNDAVIIGQNSGWDADCESILINININEFVRATQRP